MPTTMTLAAIISLILTLTAAGGMDVAKRKKLREAQQQFEQAVKDRTVTAGEQ